MKIRYSGPTLGTGEVLVIMDNGASTAKTDNRLGDERIRTKVSQLASTPSHRDLFNGKLGESAFYREIDNFEFRHVLFIGVAKDGLTTWEALRRSGAHTLALLRREKIRTATICLPDNIDKGSVQSFAEGLLLASHSFHEFKTSKQDNVFELQEISLNSSSPRSEEVEVKIAEIVSDSVAFARRLGDLPASHLTPRKFVSLVKDAAARLPLELTEWDASRLAMEKMHGLLTVSRGSSEEPRMLILRYRGADQEKPICFVGKGLTFDSGGLDIKSTKNMEDMRYDMCGAATVVAALLAIAKLKLPVNLVAFAALAENMPGPNAVKPGDIYFARNGRSVEVMNTDAEGRLVLADALCLAAEEGPSAILDVATLTGSIIAALGNIHTGVFSKSDDLLSSLREAAEHAGELIWQLPLSPEHEEDIKGLFADISNQGKSPGAGSATAAAFLAHFVPEGIRWAHLDIAGTAQHVGDRLPYAASKGASGAMVRSLIHFAKIFKSKKEIFV